MGTFAAPLLFALLAQQPAAPEDGPAFLRRYCVECHREGKAKGRVRLDDLGGDVTHGGTRWRIALDQVRSGDMPPEDAKIRPDETSRKGFSDWVLANLGSRPQRTPNLGNLVPHELLFGAPARTATGAAPRFWRMGPSAYLGWIADIARGVPAGIVPPFSAGSERGIQDFAALGRVDEPAVEVLLRNAAVVVDAQTAHRIVDGKVEGRNDTVREFVELMDPALVPDRSRLEKALQRQFVLAHGRKAGPDDLTPFLALYDACAAGGDRPAAAKAMLTAVLLRTDLVFRGELGGPGGRMTPGETARAIAAALLDRRDPGLLAALEGGRLSTPEQVAAEVRRLLDEPRIAKPRLLGFFREYFEYGRAVDVFKDEPKDLWHRPDQHVRDTDRLVLHLLAEDRDLFRRLLLTPLAFANVKAQKNKVTRQDEISRALVPNPHNQKGKAVPEALYGLAEWTPRQPFEQEAGTRAGILMQPSWLVAWSENFHTDIVRRGRFIRERFLGGVVPDLPIGVAAQVPSDRTKTLRERVSSATRAPACWTCHRLMDDLGLPFEAFDHYGRRLATDFVLDPEATAKNVDYKGKPLGDVPRPAPLVTSGLVAFTGDPALDGPVADLHELVRRLAASDRVRQVWIRHVFRYFLGRNETAADAASLQAADRAYVESGGSFKALLVSLLSSESFLSRSPARNP
jgi:hypothetical protein